MIKIALIAGEASGDLLGAHLVESLKKQFPDCDCYGIAGPKMQKAGCRTLFPQEKLAVRGFVEVVRRLPELWRIRRDLIGELKRNRPDLVIGIDAPDFNFSIEKKMKNQGVKTVHYVSPSVWAWRPGRVHKIVHWADLVLCLFPMEPKLYRYAGGQAVFVGHPLAQKIPLVPNRTAARNHLHLPHDVPVFAILPGSRVSEVDYLAETFLQTAQRLLDDFPNAQFVLPIATDATEARLNELIQAQFTHLPLLCVRSDTQNAVIASDAVLVASGTATLEVALCKRPMVIAYRISPLTFALVKRIFRLPYFGLPNVLCGRFVVPEFVQDEVNADTLAHALKDWIDNPQKVSALEQEFHHLHQILHQDSASLATQAIADLLAKQ